MTSIDPFLAKKYDRARYNCLHFTRDVWKAQTNVDITDKLSSLLNPDTRTIRKGNLESFTRLDAPVDPCLVLMRRRKAAPHVGVFVRGKVIHIHEMGVEYQPIDVATRGFESVRFYV